MHCVNNKNEHDYLKTWDDYLNTWMIDHYRKYHKPIVPPSNKATDFKPWCEQRFGIKRIIFNNPATIVFWNDGGKTVVKCSEGDEFNKFQGVAAAVMRRLYGNLHGSTNYVRKKIAKAQDDSGKALKETEKLPKKEEENSFKLEKIRFSSEQEASETLMWMKKRIKTYGSISVKEYYIAFNHKKLAKDYDGIKASVFGWTNLENTAVVRILDTDPLNQFEWCINLPEPECLIAVNRKKES